MYVAYIETFAYLFVVCEGAWIMNDEMLVNPSHISVNSTYQAYGHNEVNQIRPKNKGKSTYIKCVSTHLSYISFKFFFHNT